MASSTGRSHGGLPKQQRAVNPFDSDDEEPARSSTTSRSSVSKGSTTSGKGHSTAYSNPFDDDAPSAPPVKTKHVTHSSNPFDDDYSSPPKPTKHSHNGNKIRSGPHSSQTTSSSRDATNPFDDDYEVTSKPTARAKSQGENILDKGSLFDDDEEQRSRPVKEKKPTKAFTTRMKEGGSRIRETASNSLSNVKMPSMPSLPSGSSSHHGDEKSESSRKGKSKHQNSRDLFEDPAPAPTYNISQQQNYFSQSDESRFATQTVEELQQYAVNKSQDTTSSIRNAIRIAEDTKGVANATLQSLHDQGEQIRRTHQTAVHVDEELGRGEKLLGSLGGIFSMTWKPKKGHKIAGPQVDPDQYKRRQHLGERDSLGLHGEVPTARARQKQLQGLSGAEAQLVMEKNVQDDALNDLSNVLGQLKGMTKEMGNEIDRQNGDLDRMSGDVEELNHRVKGANQRTRHLLGR